MRTPPKSPVQVPPPRPPRDTLDDLDLQLDAVHEVTDPIHPLREDPTDVQATLPEQETDPLDSREVPTGPAEQRTAPWMEASPWVNPEAPTEKQNDPLLLPVLVFAFVLLVCIGMFVYQEMHKMR